MFTVTTDKGEWTIFRPVTSPEGDLWMAQNVQHYNITADTLDHLFIKIDQFEHPEGDD